MKKIKLTQGKYALIDNEDFKRINQFKWHANFIDGYWRAMRNIRKPNGKRETQLMHRFIMNTPKGMDTDHKNHDGLDNQKHNLRICTMAQNQHNQKLRQNTSSKYKGVTWHEQLKKWRTRIRLNGKRIHLGYYINEIKAARAYDMKAKELFGEFAYLNFQ